MLQLLTALLLATSVVAQDAFFEKYSFSKAMANCFGDELYYSYLIRIGLAERECQQLPISNLQRVDSSVYSQIATLGNVKGLAVYIPFPSGGHLIQHSHPHFHYVKKRHVEQKEEKVVEEPPQHIIKDEETQQPQESEPFFNREYLIDSVNKIMAAFSNYTCTLHKLGMIDEYLNLNLTGAIENYRSAPLSDGFKKDLIDGITYCTYLTQCLPLEKLKSPLPLNLQRVLAAMRCEKETRASACFKEDLRRSLDAFDLSLFGSDEDEETKLNKLSAIVMGIESLDELEIV